MDGMGQRNCVLHSKNRIAKAESICGYFELDEEKNGKVNKKKCLTRPKNHEKSLKFKLYCS